MRSTGQGFIQYWLIQYGPAGHDVPDAARCVLQRG